MLKRLEGYFEFTRLGTNWRTEILAGITTFLTMAYIVLVNPAILADAGLPLPAVTAATCLSAAFGSILMGLFARYPIALAPGMGLNAYFAYAVCIKMHIPWQTALGAVFLSGVIFLALTAAGIRQMILHAIPHELYAAVAGGFHALADTAFKLDIRGALNKGLLEIVFVFFFVDLFDNLGTLVAVTKRAGLITADNSIPRLNRILLADATSTA